MRRLAVALLAPATAIAAPVEGQVTSAQSHWTPDGSRIVTDAVVQTAGGDVTVSQLGGTVDGLTMRTFPSPEMLALGMRVALEVHADTDLALRPFVVVDDVRVLALPAGFVRTGPTKHGKPLYWESGCIFVSIDRDGTKEINGDDEFPIVDASIATWNDSTAGCSYMTIVSDGRTAQPAEVGRDYINLIKFRDASWCRPAVNGDPARCYPESAAGITTAVFHDDGGSQDGQIVDADIEINGKNFAISANHQSLGTMPCRAELANTLVHELGHLHGLEHTCLAVGDPQRIDDQGKAVPSCSGTTDPKVIESTMYNFQDCDETKKEDLSSDDITAICSIYPTSKDPHTCAPVPPPGCCDVGGQPSVPGLVVACWILRPRRKRR